MIKRWNLCALVALGALMLSSARDLYGGSSEGQNVLLMSSRSPKGGSLD